MYRNFELDDPAYEPVIERASTLWRELESASGRRLRYPTGVLLTGCRSSPQMQRALQSAERSDKPSRALAPEEVRAEYPQFKVADDDIGLWDPEGGVIRPELTVSVAVQLASAHGAVIHDFTRVEAVEEEGAKVRVVTADDAQVFDRVVIACGGWTTKLRPDLKEKVVVRRLTSAWFQAEDDAYLEGLVPFMRTAPTYGVHAAEAAEVSRRAVVNVEPGAANPSLGTLMRISDAWAWVATAGSSRLQPRWDLFAKRSSFRVTAAHGRAHWPGSRPSLPLPNRAYPN